MVYKIFYISLIIDNRVPYTKMPSFMIKLITFRCEPFGTIGALIVFCVGMNHHVLIQVGSIRTNFVTSLKRAFFYFFHSSLHFRILSWLFLIM